MFSAFVGVDRTVHDFEHDNRRDLVQAAYIYIGLAVGSLSSSGVSTF